MLRRSFVVLVAAKRSSSALSTDQLKCEKKAAPSLGLSGPTWTSGSTDEAAAGAVASTRGHYAKAGHDFIEHLRVAGPRSVLDGLQSSLLLYGLAGAALVLYAIVWLTTYAFVITTDPSPQRNTMFQRYPSDYVVLINRWTGRRRVVTVEAAPEDLRHPDGTLPYRDRIVHVNRLRDRLVVYQQPTHSIIVVDVASVLAPMRFARAVREADGRGAVAVHRVDQLVPDAHDENLNRTSARKGAVATAMRSGTPLQPHRLLVETEMRMRDTRNGGAQGNILAFRETVSHVVEDVLVSRYYDALLARTMEGGMRRPFAEEMIRNGSVTTEGIFLTAVVPTLVSFEAEVFREVTRRMGEDVLLYKHAMRWV